MNIQYSSVNKFESLHDSFHQVDDNFPFFFLTKQEYCSLGYGENDQFRDVVARKNIKWDVIVSMIMTLFIVIVIVFTHLLQVFSTIITFHF